MGKSSLVMEQYPTFNENHKNKTKPTSDATMSIKKHYLEQILSLFWDVVSDENWFLCSDDGEVDDGVLLRLMREKLPNIEDHP